MARSRRDAPPGRSPMAKCPRNAFPRRPTVARYRCGVFSGCRPWRYFAVVRFRPAGRGKISPRCVPGRRSVAAFSLHAFPKGPRTGKAPVRGSISPPCIQNELASARYSRHASEKPRKRAFGNSSREYLAAKGPFSLRGPLTSCTASRSCHSWVLRLSALIFLGWGAAAETMRTVRRPAQDVPAVAPPLHAPLRPVRVAGSACLVAHMQLLFARIAVAASATMPKRRDRVVYRRKRGAVMVFR